MAPLGSPVGIKAGCNANHIFRDAEFACDNRSRHGLVALALRHGANDYSDAAISANSNIGRFGVT